LSQLTQNLSIFNPKNPEKTYPGSRGQKSTGSFLFPPTFPPNVPPFLFMLQCVHVCALIDVFAKWHQPI
jgi:hypothetical protein